MKKIVVTIICVVASLMLTGIAYASWSISTDVTVNAGTAELEAQIVEACVNYTSKGVVCNSDNIVICDNKKSANVNINNIYPGAEVQLEIVVKNTGTMGISFDQIIQKFDDVIDVRTCENFGLDSSLLKNIVISYDAETRDESNRRLMKIPHETATGEQSIRNIFCDVSPMPIQPEETLILIIEIKMDENAGNETMNKSYSFTMSPLFVQN